MVWSNLKDEFEINDIGARLLANLARGIYSHEAVLREYVQNAADAYEQLRAAGSPATEPKITISLEGDDALSIHDNGIGMSEKVIREAKKIAVSPKTKANLTGFRGIGIWAGFQACDTLVVVTTRKGETARYRLTIDFKEILKHVDDDINIKQLLDNRFRLEESAADTNEHYTIVTLHGLHAEYKKLRSPQELKRIVSQNLPCRIDPKFKYRAELEKFVHEIEGYQEYHILVGKDEVFKDLPADVEVPATEVLKEGSVELARVWWSAGNGMLKVEGNQFRGFRLRVRNFAVGRVGIYDDEDGAAFGGVDSQQLKTKQRLNWFVGEIHITNSEIVPDTPRSQLEAGTISRVAIAKIRSFYFQRTAEAGARSDFNTAREVVVTAQKQLAAGALEPQQAEELLQKLRKQEKTLDGKAPADLSKKKYRELLSGAEIKQTRRALIKQLEAVLAQSPPATSTPATATSAPATKSSTTPTKAEAAKESTEPAPANSKSEQLLSDILAVISDKLDDDDLVAEIAAALQTLFEQCELIDSGK